MQRFQDEIERELDPLFKQLLQKSVSSTAELEELVQKTQIEWEKLNVETNERLYVLQRAHTLYSEIEGLQNRVESIIERVDQMLTESIDCCTTLHQAKSHLHRLKVSSPLVD